MNGQRHVTGVLVWFAHFIMQNRSDNFYLIKYHVVFTLRNSPTRKNKADSQAKN